MTKHWLFITAYILFIAMVTYFVATYTEAEKVVTFLADQESSIGDSNFKLLSSTVAANNGDGTDAIIQIEPLYEQSFVEGDNRVDISIYTLIEYHSSYSNHAVAILIKNLSIDDESLYKDDDQYSQIKANIEFSEVVTLGKTKSRSFSETFITLYNDKQKLIMMNFDRLESDLPILFKYIQISYLDVNQMSKPLINLNNSDISDMQSDIFDQSFDRDIKNLNETNIKIMDQNALVDFENNEDLYYDHISSLFDSYNSLYFKNIGIEVLIIIPITYLVFFNNYVVAYFKEKHKLKKEAHLNKQLAIKKQLTEKNEETK